MWYAVLLQVLKGELKMRISETNMIIYYENIIYARQSNQGIYLLQKYRKFMCNKFSLKNKTNRGISFYRSVVFEVGIMDFHK